MIHRLQEKVLKYRKDATISFKNHEASGSQKEPLQVVVVIPSTCLDVGEMLSTEHAHEKSENRVFYGYCRTFIFYLDRVFLLGVVEMKLIPISYSYYSYVV